MGGRWGESESVLLSEKYGGGGAHIGVLKRSDLFFKNNSSTFLLKIILNMHMTSPVISDYPLKALFFFREFFCLHDSVKFL